MRTSFTSGDWTTAAKVGGMRRSYPLPRYPAAYSFEQDYTIAVGSFAITALNTPDSTDTNAILQSESTQRDIGNLMTQWTRRYVKVPATWNDYQTQNITFPGIRDVAYTGGVRDPKPLNVTVRFQYDYYVLDPGNVLGSGCASGGGPANAASVVDSGSTAVKCVYSLGDIPEIRRTPFGFLVSSAMLTTAEIAGLVKRGGITGWLETVPSTERYQTWMAYAVAHGWNSTVWDGQYADPDSSATTHQGVTTIAQWCFENSRLTVHEGNIIARITPYTLAN